MLSFMNLKGVTANKCEVSLYGNKNALKLDCNDGCTNL